MARIDTVLSVFVASPGDVVDARKCLERVVDELNFSWSREMGLRLELLKWETHAFSDKGDDAQDVVNRQIPRYDIFLGIMWKRFGTPTGRAESGTEEEFNDALCRHERDASNVRIMFYFKDTPPGRLSEVDGKEIEKVKQFRDRVAESGVLYWSYKSLSEFENLTRQHLSRQVQAWGKTWGGVIAESSRRRRVTDTLSDAQQPTIEPDNVARSITAIVFEQMAFVGNLTRRPSRSGPRRATAEPQKPLPRALDLRLGKRIRALRTDNARRIVALRSANARRFAERKATMRRPPWTAIIRRTHEPALPPR
jgi:hypothetical protein